jgi:hypothetical protein
MDVFYLSQLINVSHTSVLLYFWQFINIAYEAFLETTELNCFFLVVHQYRPRYAIFSGTSLSCSIFGNSSMWS